MRLILCNVQLIPTPTTIYIPPVLCFMIMTQLLQQLSLLIIIKHL